MSENDDEILDYRSTVPVELIHNLRKRLIACIILEFYYSFLLSSVFLSFLLPYLELMELMAIVLIAISLNILLP